MCTWREGRPGEGSDRHGRWPRCTSAGAPEGLRKEKGGPRGREAGGISAELGEVQLGKMRKFWRWMVVMTAEQREGTECSRTPCLTTVGGGKFMFCTFYPHPLRHTPRPSPAPLGTLLTASPLGSRCWQTWWKLLGGPGSRCTSPALTRGQGTVWSPVSATQGPSEPQGSLSDCPRNPRTGKFCSPLGYVWGSH